MYPFYAKVLNDLVSSGDVTRDDRCLVVCGGDGDAATLKALNFTDVVISNVGAYGSGEYPLLSEDAEQLSMADKSYDVVMVHLGLHHCHSPHRALLEMYRVARKAVVVIENRDSFAMKLATRLGLAADYEIEAVTASGYVAGGVANGPVPNYVYRWTEREISKAIQSYDPAHTSRFKYHYDLSLPFDRMRGTSNKLKQAVLLALAPVALVVKTLMPQQGNLFGFAIVKQAGLKPWLVEGADGLVVSREWAESQKKVYIEPTARCLVPR